jgi:SAM-dependent methyltransferase
MRPGKLGVAAGACHLQHSGVSPSESRHLCARLLASLCGGCRLPDSTWRYPPTAKSVLRLLSERVVMNDGRISEAFADPQSPLFADLESKVATSHWARMLGNPGAVEQKLRRSRYVFERIEGGGGRILDFGSGMGFLSCYMAAAGASEVVGVEIVPELRATAEHLASKVFEVANLRFLGSAAGLEGGSFDAAVMCNAVSHFDDLSQLLIHTAELLKPGGPLFVEDNNNKQSILQRLSRRRQWEADDEGASRCRAEIDPGRERLTYGMSGEEVERWRGRDLAPLQRLREFAPYDVRHGMYHENWFTVRELELLVFHAGFAPVEHRAKYVFDYRPHRAAAAVFRRLPRLSLYAAPAFEVLAVRV